MTEQQEYMLENGLCLTVKNVSSHYFGGYWQVALEINSAVPVTEECFESRFCYEDARRLLGDRVNFVRRLEKMAVSGGDVELVLKGLSERICNTILPLVSGERFPLRFVATEYEKRLKKNLRSIPLLS